MKATFDKKRDYVYEVDYNLPYSQEEVIADLSSEDWDTDANGYGQAGFNQRFRLHEPSSPRLKNMLEYFNGEVFKQEIIDQLYSEQWFPGYWGVSPERMLARTTAFGTLTLDRPGFITGMHLDNRALVASGMCYFIDGDDPDQSTTFYTTAKKDDPLRMTTGFGRGWIAAGMHDAWHDGHNRSTKDRYTILLGLVIRF